MRLVTFGAGNGARLGALSADDVIERRPPTRSCRVTLSPSYEAARSCANERRRCSPIHPKPLAG